MRPQSYPYDGWVSRTIVLASLAVSYLCATDGSLTLPFTLIVADEVQHGAPAVAGPNVLIPPAIISPTFKWEPTYEFSTTTLTQPIRVTKTIVNTIGLTTTLPVTLIDVDVSAADNIVEPKTTTETLTVTSRSTELSIITLLSNTEGLNAYMRQYTEVSPTTVTTTIVHTLTETKLAAKTTLWTHRTVPPDCSYIDIQQAVKWRTKTVTETTPQLVDGATVTKILPTTTAQNHRGYYDHEQPTTTSSPTMDVSINGMGKVSLLFTKTKFQLNTVTEVRNMTITTTVIQPTRSLTILNINRVTSLLLIPNTTATTITITSLSVHNGFYSRQYTQTLSPTVIQEIHTTKHYYETLKAAATRYFIQPTVEDCTQVDNVTIYQTALVMLTKTVPMLLTRYKQAVEEVEFHDKLTASLITGNETQVEHFTSFPETLPVHLQYRGLRFQELVALKSQPRPENDNALRYVDDK